MAQRTTLRDVAKEAGVSTGAVSLILNGRPNRLSAETRDAVLAAAQKLHYVPNQNARSLVTNRTTLIALIVPDIENMYFASLARCIEEECQKQGYSLLIANSNDSRDTESNLIQRLTSRDVDGLMFIPSNESYDYIDQMRTQLETVPCPVTFIDRMVAADWCDSVGFDNRQGGRLAAQCLLDAGHTRIGCITGDKHAKSSSSRWLGFARRLDEAGVTLDPDLQVAGDYRVDSGYRGADQIIDGGATAVFCCNDLMALGFLNRLRERGLDCPHDMSVIGYDNILPRFGLQTEVTTIEQDVVLLAQRSWQMLYARICESHSQGSPWMESPRVQLLKPTLIDNHTVRHL